MVGAPAKCPHCGTIFLSDVFEFVSGEVTFGGVGVACVKCGKAAKVLDGAFDYVDHAIHVLRASPETIEVVRLLQEALHAAEAGSQPDDVIAKVEAVAPSVAERIRGLIPKVGWVPALLLLLAAKTTTEVKVTVDVNLLLDQIQVARGAPPHPAYSQPRAGKTSPGNHEQSREAEWRLKQKQQREAKAKLPKPSA